MSVDERQNANSQSGRKLGRWHLGKYIVAATYLFFCVMLMLQNPMSMLVSNYSIIAAKVVLALKDFVLYISLFTAAIIMLLKPIRCAVFPVSWLIVIVVCVFAVLDGVTSILSFRQLLIIPLVLIFGDLLFKLGLNLKFVFLTYIIIIILLVIFGYIERFVLYDTEESFWNSVGIRDYMDMKGMIAWANNENNVSNSFYSYDFYTYSGEKVRRMVSLIAEPTLFGELLVFPSLYYVLRKKYFYALFFTLPIIFALSKGGVFGLVFGVLIYAWQQRAKKILKVLVLVIIVALSALIVFLYSNNYVQSITNHLNGLLSSLYILSSHPFGLGVSRAGNFYNMTSSGVGLTTGESYLGAIVGQFGFFGLFLYLLFIRVIYKCNAYEPILMATKYSMLAVLLSGFFSESSLSYVGSSMLLVLTSFLLNYSKVGNQLCKSYI